jgi:hypothetical protein
MTSIRSKAADKTPWSFVENIKDKLTRSKTPRYAAFKTVGDNRWLAYWTNNFEDRDGEIFSAKAIDEYIARVDVGVVPMPELWFWHIPGTKHGQADWLGRIGHFCVASGTFDDSDAGKRAHKFYGRQTYAVSHGFRYPLDQLVDGVYHQFNTFEISPLPPDEAANPYTSFEDIKAMSITPRKLKQLKELFGDEIAAEIIASATEKSKAIEALGAKYKDFVKMSEDDAPRDTEDMAEEEEVAVTEEVDSDMKTDIATLFPELVTEIGVLATMITSLLERVQTVEQAEAQRKSKQRSLETDISALKASVTKLTSAFNDRPRSAVRGESNPLPETHELRKDAQYSAEVEALRRRHPDLLK